MERFYDTLFQWAISALKSFFCVIRDHTLAAFFFFFKDWINQLYQNSTFVAYKITSQYLKRLLTWLIILKYLLDSPKLHIQKYKNFFSGPKNSLIKRCESSEYVNERFKKEKVKIKSNVREIKHV